MLLHPDGHQVRAHFRAQPESGAFMQLDQSEVHWHRHHKSLLGMLHDVKVDMHILECSGGTSTLIHDWAIEQRDLAPTVYEYVPEWPTTELILT